MRDWKLALVVTVFVLIDIITLVVYTIVEGLGGNLNAILVQNEENPSTELGIGVSIFTCQGIWTIAC